MTDFRVVQARPEDLAAYLDILEEVTAWLVSKRVSHPQPGTYRRCESYFGESIERGEVYLLNLGGAPAGTLRLVPEDPVVWPEITGDDGIYVYNLAVRRSWAGRQLGRRLLEWADERTASLGRDWLRLDCFADNPLLCRYYSDAGFVDRGDVDAEYPEPLGTLRLRRFEKRVREPQVDRRSR